MTRDLVNNLKDVVGLAPVIRTTTVLSAACDLRGFHSAVARIHVGVYGDTASGSLYIEAELQESSDDSTYTAVANADLLFGASSGLAARTGTAVGTFFQSKTTAAADLAGIYVVGYRGSKRYIKVNTRLTGTHSTGSPIAVTFSMANAEYAPI